MKIASISPIRPEDMPLRFKNTASHRNALIISQHLQSNPHLIISCEEIKPQERQHIQKKLRDLGHHVLVHTGPHPTTKKLALFIRTLSDVEWRDYIKK
jgi:hypothetical protein